MGKKNGFKSIEMLQAVVLTADEWTPESGLVTAAQKLQRKKIAQRYDAEVMMRACLLHFAFAVVLCHVTQARTCTAYYYTINEMTELGAP